MFSLLEIKRILSIEIETVRDGHYRADAKIFPGSPPLGIGDTELTAIGDLIARVVLYYPTYRALMIEQIAIDKETNRSL